MLTYIRSKCGPNGSIENISLHEILSFEPTIIGSTSPSCVSWAGQDGRFHFHCLTFPLLPPALTLDQSAGQSLSPPSLSLVESTNNNHRTGDVVLAHHNCLQSHILGTQTFLSEQSYANSYYIYSITSFVQHYYYWYAHNFTKNS